MIESNFQCNSIGSNITIDRKVNRGRKYVYKVRRNFFFSSRCMDMHVHSTTAAAYFQRKHIFYLYSIWIESIVAGSRAHPKPSTVHTVGIYEG